MKKIIHAASALIYQNNKILLIKRAKEPWKGKWATPGGKIDNGETSEHAVIREVSEELNVKFFPKRKLNTYHFEDDNHIANTEVFIGKIEGNIKIKKNEISDFKWLSPKEALKLDMSINNKKRIEDFIKLQESRQTLKFAI